MSAAGRFLRLWRGQGKYAEVEGYCHWCPGCKYVHSITTKGREPVWGFDGDFVAPTFTPSIRVFVHKDGVEHTVCHYFIKSGTIEFCTDSEHGLRGQTVPLPEWPYAPGEYGGIEE